MDAAPRRCGCCRESGRRPRARRSDRAVCRSTEKSPVKGMTAGQRALPFAYLRHDAWQFDRKIIEDRIDGRGCQTRILLVHHRVIGCKAERRAFRGRDLLVDCHEFLETWRKRGKVAVRLWRRPSRLAVPALTRARSTSKSFGTAARCTQSRRISARLARSIALRALA